MSNRLSKASHFFALTLTPDPPTNIVIAIARSALAQEEAEEFNGEFSDPINIHLDNERDGCAC